LKDPLIIRISAGPGCSALYSAFYSKGPFVFVKGTKNFRVNPFNWNKQANVLFIEGPGEVGFSKGADKLYTDDTVAQIYYLAI
jgi:serine carboxypeptidase-like clade 2